MSQLALFGGPTTVLEDKEDVFTRFPGHVMKEMEEAVLDVLHQWSMSDTALTKEFEQGYAAWHGLKYGLGFNNGTAAILGAMYGVGVGAGDEIICPSVTYWASCLPVYSLRASVVFADIDPHTLCLDPEDVKRKITKRTKAIMVVHYAGMPAEMEAIMDVASQAGVKVIEDASHAHGALYKGNLVGTFGDVSAFSLMSGKSFGTGEAGILLTNDREIYERSLVLGHYNLHGELTLEYLRKGGGLPWGGCKNRMHQMSAALGLVQLRHYPALMEEIDHAMNYFWDQLDGVAGLAAHRPPSQSGSTKGGWYFPLGLYNPEELGGLSVTTFAKAMRAEGVPVYPGCNKALHGHPLFESIDIYNEQQPTRTAHAVHDLVKLQGDLPVSESIQSRVFQVPLFFRCRPKIIDSYARAYKKVSDSYQELLPIDEGNPAELGMHFRF